MNVIVIAPHADDEVLGCGASIAKYVDNGDKVIIVIATNASEGAPELFNEKYISTIRAEAKDAHALLGVNETVFMEFPAPALDIYPSYKISLAFSDIFKQYKPTHLFLPHPFDLHVDHSVIYKSALVSARPQGGRKISYVYCYETLSETEWAPNQPGCHFTPNHFVNVSEHFFKKVEALKCFKTQLKEFPHPRSIEAITALATLRGSTVGVDKAEAFVVERQIV